MMSAREAVKKTIEFDNPGWTPYHISIQRRQLEASCPPGALDAIIAELLEVGAIERDGSLLAQDIMINLPPTPTHLPEPYRPLGQDEWVDEWGTLWTCREFPRVNGHPLEAGWSLLDGYTLPEPGAPGRYDKAVARSAAAEGRYRVGWVWFTLFERFWFLRGFNNALTDPYLHPREFSRLVERITNFNLASIQRQLDLGADGIFFSDDWGSQASLLMNPVDWRRWYKPHYKRMFDAVHAGGAHVWMHLCGNVMDIIPDLIEIGLNVLNPVQPLAMPIDVLSDRFGGRLCFYGGLDVQSVLPHGSPQDVADEVARLIRALGSLGGGYIGGTSHTILPDTPAGNVVAAFRAFRELSGAG